MSCWEKRRKKWCASIRINTKKKHFGYFDTKAEADSAERIAREKYPSKEGQRLNSHNIAKQNGKFYIRFLVKGKEHNHGPFETRDEAIKVSKFLKDEGIREKPKGSVSSRNTSGHTGIYWYIPTNKWRAEIFQNGKQIYLGYFDTIEEAIAARKAAEDVGD